MDNPSDQLLEFFYTIWGVPEVASDTDYVYIASLDSERKMAYRNFYNWPKDARIIVNRVFSQAAAGQEVFYCPSIFSHNSPKKEFFKRSRVLWVDFDGNAPQESLWDEKAHAGVPKPCVRIQTSTADRQHHYWVLDTPFTDSKELESRNRTLAYDLQADFGGWDCTQLLRPPYTTNFGHSKPERKGATYDVVIEELVGDRLYEQSRFVVSESIGKVVAKEFKVVTPLKTLYAFNEWTDKLFDDLDHKPDINVRSDAITSVAHQAAELNWSDQHIYSLAWHMDELARKYADRDDRSKRLADIVARVRLAHPFGDKKVETKTNFKELFSVGEYDMITVNPEWIIPGLMTTDSLGLVVSQPGVGKTQLAFNMAMAFAGERNEFLGWDIERRNKPYRVLFMSLEMSLQRLKIFTDQMNLASRGIADMKDSFYIYATGSPLLLDDDKGRAVFEDLLRQTTPDVIFIDHLSYIISKSVNDDEAAKKVFQYLGQIRQQYKAGVIILHHDRKRVSGEKRKATSLDDTYGNRVLSAECDFILTLDRTADPSTIAVNTEKTRLGPYIPPFEISRTEHLGFVKTNAGSHRIAPSGGSKDNPIDPSGGILGSNIPGH